MTESTDKLLEEITGALKNLPASDLEAISNTLKGLSSPDSTTPAS